YSLDAPTMIPAIPRYLGQSRPSLEDLVIRTLASSERIHIAIAPLPLRLAWPLHADGTGAFYVGRVRIEGFAVEWALVLMQHVSISQACAGNRGTQRRAATPVPIAACLHNRVRFRSGKQSAWPVSVGSK